MALKNRKPATAMIPDRPVEILIYGPPNSGKTTIAATARRPLYLDFEASLSRSDLVSNVGDRVDVQSWSDVAGIEESDLAENDSVVIDSMSALYRHIGASLGTGGKAAMRQADGTLTQKGYQSLLQRFSSLRDRIIGWGKDLILIAHSEEKADASDELRIRPALTAGATKVITQDADLIAYCEIRRGERIMSVVPDIWIGKGPSDWGTMKVPDLRAHPQWLAERLDELRALRRQRQQHAAEAVDQLEEFKQAWSDADFSATETFDACLAVIKVQPKGVSIPAKHWLNKLAQENGITWDRQENRFVVKP